MLCDLICYFLHINSCLFFCYKHLLGLTNQFYPCHSIFSSLRTDLGVRVHPQTTIELYAKKTERCPTHEEAMAWPRLVCCLGPEQAAIGLILAEANNDEEDDVPVSIRPPAGHAHDRLWTSLHEREFRTFQVIAL